MKKLFLVIVILTPAMAGFTLLALQADFQRRELESCEMALRRQQRELADLQSREQNLTATVRGLSREARDWSGATVMDPAVARFLRTNDVKSASPEMLEKILAALKAEGNSSGKYHLVSKAALMKVRMPLLQAFPASSKLKASACGVLAVTPEEQQAVEAAFAQAYEASADWARTNVTRDGGDNYMIARYTLPVDAAFSEAVSNRLFSSIESAVGRERTELMNVNYQNSRVYEDGAIAERTNILEIYQAKGRGPEYRSGSEWGDFGNHSSSVNTSPELIRPNRFPAAFRFVFPGGWKDIAQREGFELPENFGQKR